MFSGKSFRTGQSTPGQEVNSSLPFYVKQARRWPHFSKAPVHILKPYKPNRTHQIPAEHPSSLFITQNPVPSKCDPFGHCSHRQTSHSRRPRALLPFLGGLRQNSHLNIRGGGSPTRHECAEAMSKTGFLCRCHCLCMGPITGLSLGLAPTLF